MHEGVRVVGVHQQVAAKERRFDRAVDGGTVLTIGEAMVCLWEGGRGGRLGGRGGKGAEGGEVVVEQILDLEPAGLARRVVECFAVLLQRLEVKRCCHHCC